MNQYLESEFDKQVQTLLNKEYPKHIGISQQEFLEKVNLLKEKLNEYDLLEIDLDKGYLPFVIVVKSELINTQTAMSLVSRNGFPGVTKMTPHNTKDFKTISEVTIPQESIYLLIGIDRGKESINLAPKEAMNIINKDNRQPLTIDEGVAIVTLYPQFLQKNNCFSLLASRKSGSKSVPAIWINSKKEVNLGWCWDGNPHTWLGSASAKERI